MKFDDLDKKMRVYETAHDHCILPGMWIVARLDGRSFTRLTKETMGYEAPFDDRFRDAMVATVEHLMTCGFKVTYGYTESDEISLLFARNLATFGRKERKINSVLAGEASAKMSLLLGTPVCFDCRVSQLPSDDTVIDYFRWRNEDSARNALNSYCYWTMRKDGMTARQATAYLVGMSVALKNQLLFDYGINFNDLPNWQKRGVGVIWEKYVREATNPVTGEQVSCNRKRLKILLDLPMKEQYEEFIEDLLLQEILGL